MIDRQIQVELEALERKMNATINSVRTSVDNVSASVDSLTNTVSGLSTLSFAEITNILDDSFPEFSADAYQNLGVSPSTVSDLNRKAHNWYRVERTEPDLAQTDALSLKASGHSLFAGTEGLEPWIPRWILPEGHIQMGGSVLYDLVYLLPNELVYPGLVFYVQFEAMLASGTTPDSQFYASFYDNTAGQKKTIEGGNFTITGEIYGTPGSRSVEYQVLARTDSGEEAISNILAFTTAPSTFDQNNHPRINFRGAPGYIEFEIYRKEVASSTFVLQYVVRNSIEGTYFDVGNDPVRVVTAFPGVSATPPKAYAKTRTFRPGSTNFVKHTLTIQVPTTYDSSATGAGMQWLRMGLTDITDDGQILVRKFGLSLGDGGWSRSANDNREGAHSTRTAVAAAAPSGDSGGGTDQPPVIGSGGHCVTMDSMVSVLSDGRVIEITLEELQRRCLTEEIYCFSAGIIGGKVRTVRKAYASRVYHIKTLSSSVTCTPDHPFILSQTDIHGTPASKLEIGDELLVYKDGHAVAEAILEMTEAYGDFEIGIPQLQGSHICVLNGYISHNKSTFDPNEL